MATMRMLIDALHPEETRVAVLDGNRLEDIDVEVASRKQLKGNIYLAKVTRVEPSLQAAFVDYGGNRHGFLAFNEIHPDYYQIPVADREALVAEHDAGERADEAKRLADDAGGNGAEGSTAHGDVEVVGGDDIEEVEVRRPAAAVRRHYKIQEVIKRRQILLIQVVKEERGNKGAALTTYLSLAGRYCVLMPNTARGGGISRKIPAGKDRKRLKSILADLNIPDGMGVIVRTAGLGRSKAEIRRDYEYLLRLWDSVRQTTMESIAPVLVYEEANLIKRSIRDLYNRDIEEIVVEGEEGYKTARNFMKLMIPSHLKRVTRYEDDSMPLFHRYQVESQQDAMHSPTVRLKSGGYIVINPTEALVSIDVNSGRSTRERNIEETALRTNLEACEEVARQLRLRDLAGLIVVDFIDMEVTRNRIQVERRLKDAMRNDRARIQLGRISPFGLMELSRQRLRPSVIETSFETCPHCGGAGVRRSTESTALHILRAIEEEGIKRRSLEATFHVPSDVALYLLNHKRSILSAIEARYGFQVFLGADDSLVPPDHRIERTRVRAPEDRAAAGAAEEAERPEAEAGAEEEPGKKRRRRRSRRRKRPEDAEAPATQEGAARQAVAEDAEVAEEAGESAEATRPGAEGEGQERTGKRRRRGKRGGRRRHAKAEAGQSVEAPADAEASTVVEIVEIEAAPAVEAAPEAEVTPEPPAEGEEKPAKKRRSRKKKAEAEPVAEPAAEAAAEPAAEGEEKPATKRRRTRKKKADAKPADSEAKTAGPATEPKAEAEPASTPEPAPEAMATDAAPVPTPEPEPAPEPKVEAKTELKPAPEPDAAADGPAKPQQGAGGDAAVIDVDSLASLPTAREPRRGWWRR